MQPIRDIIQKFLTEEVISSLEHATRATDILKAEHRKVELLFKQFTKARGKDKQLIFDSIINELLVHATVEEELIYPIIAKKEQFKADEAQEEHHMVKLSLAELTTMSADEELTAPKLKVLSEMVMMHVKEEEHDLFHILENSGENMEELGRLIKLRKAKLSKTVVKNIAKPALKKTSSANFSKSSHRTGTSSGARRPVSESQPTSGGHSQVPSRKSSSADSHARTIAESSTKLSRTNPASVKQSKTGKLSKSNNRRKAS
jgi:hemerythrin superfamily protein